MNKKEISNKNLEKISGGFGGLIAWNHNSIPVTQEEYDELQKGGFIVEGKLKNDSVRSAGNYLNQKGFKGRIFATGFIPMGADLNRKSEFANIIITKNDE